MKATRKHILIVEDDSGIRFVLEKFLRHFFDVTSSSNGKEALFLMKKKIPDLVITDLDMPIINGVQFLRNKRSSLYLKDVPIIIISGLNKYYSQQMCKGHEILFYFEKPFNPANLALKMCDYFNISTKDNKKIKTLMQINNIKI